MNGKVKKYILREYSIIKENTKYKVHELEMICNLMIYKLPRT